MAYLPKHDGTWQQFFGINPPECSKYPKCKVVDGSCMKSHLKDGWKKCGYPWKTKRKK